MIREFIQQEMIKQGLSATALAEKAGIRPASVTEFFSGKKNLRSDNIDKLIDCLGASLPPLEELVNNFTKGSTTNIYELMVIEAAKSECLIENRVVSYLQLASYIMGIFAASIYMNFPKDARGKGYSILDKITRKNKDGHMSFDKTITECYVKYVDYYDERVLELLPILFLHYQQLPSDNVDEVKFISAFMRYV